MPSKKFVDYPPLTHTRERFNEIRVGYQMSTDDVAKLISEDTGYAFTGHQLYAIERGITKDVPLWVAISFMKVMQLPTADSLFPYVESGFV